MIKYKFTADWRPDVTEFKGKRVIDVGGANSFADGYLDAICEIRQPQATAKYNFIGDMNYPEFWEPVLAHVAKYGKWDYAICSHTLEDITHPIYVARMLERIAHAGIIIVPSKHREMGRFAHPYLLRGWWHHHWIFDITDGVLMAYPKINFVEDKRFDEVHKLHDAPHNRAELVVEWTGAINMQHVDRGGLYDGGREHMYAQYTRLCDVLPAEGEL